MAKKATYGELEQRVRELENERRQPEVVMGEGREKYQTILESIEDGYFEVDLLGNFTFFNDSMCKILGYSKDVLMGMNNHEYMDEETAKTINQTFKKVYQAGVSAKAFDWKLIRKDRSERFVETVVSLIKDSKEKKIGFRGIARDVTERKQNEEKILESQEKFRNLVENVPDIIYSLDKSAKIIAINLPVSGFYGYKTDEILGNDFSTFIHPEDKDRVIHSFIEAVAAHREWTRGLQFRMVSKSGLTYWVELNSHMQFDEDGNYKREEGVLRDINDRKKAEEALQEMHRELEERIEKRTAELTKVNRQLHQEIQERIKTEAERKNSEERLNIIYEYAPDAYFLVDLNRQLIDGNKAAERLTGYKKEELVGRDFIEAGLLSGDQFSTALKNFKKNIEGLTAGPVEFVLCRKDRKKVDVEINTFPVKINGQDIVLGAARDITERKQAEESLRKLYSELEKRVEKRTKDLEELNAALKVLLNKRQEDKEELEEGILSSVRTLVEPYIVKLKNSKLSQNHKVLLEILESNLNEIISPFTRKLSSKYYDLTTKEIEIANLVRHGKTNKEIAGIQGVASRTIAAHRENIRKKLNLTNKKTNLKTYLQTLD